MRIDTMTTATVILASLLACGDSTERDEHANGDRESETSDAGDSSGGQGGDDNNQPQNDASTDTVSGSYMSGTADALIPTSGFVFTDPRDQNQDQEAYKIILTSEPSVGCNIKELDAKLGMVDRFDDGVDKIRYLSCRLRATDTPGRHPATVLGVGIGGFVALPPDQLDCAPVFSMMGKSVGERVVGSMRWFDAERNDAEVASFQFDLTYCGEVDTHAF